MNIYKIIVAIASVAVVFLGGCAAVPSSVSLDRAKVQSLRNTFLDPVVQKPAEVIFLTGSGGTAGMPVASLLTNDHSGLSQLSIGELLEKQRIDIGQIVLDEAKQIISQKRSISLTSESSSEVTFKFVVDAYGLVKTHPFGSVYDAVIRVTSRLYARNGELLWQESEAISGLAMDNNKGQTLDIYYSNPETLRVALATASRVAITRILSKLPE